MKDIKIVFMGTPDFAEESLKKIYEAGHEIGTHSNTHPHVEQLSAEKNLEEINANYARSGMQLVRNAKKAFEKLSKNAKKEGPESPSHLHVPAFKSFLLLFHYVRCNSITDIRCYSAAASICSSVSSAITS